MKKNPGNKGFTLVELLVSFALFAIILSIVTGIFISALRSQKDITALIAANDNAYLSLEQMARELRVGRNFIVESDTVSFTTPFGSSVKYLYRSNYDFGDGKIAGAILRRENGGFETPITAENIDIKNLRISSIGAAVGDGLPTRITLFLSVSASGAVRLKDATTDIETTITVRNLDS